MKSKQKGSPHKRKVFVIALLFQVLVLLVLWFVTPLRKSSLSFDPEEAREKAKKVAQANKKRIENEKIRREKTKLTKKDADKLKKKEEEKRKRNLVNKLEEMRTIRREIVRKKIKKLRDLKKRNSEDMNKATMPKLLAAAQAIPNELVHIKIRSGSEFATSLHKDAVWLFESTKQYLDDFSLIGQNELRLKASILEGTLIEERDTNALRIGSNQMSNFNIFGNNAIRKISIFKNLLGSLKISDESIEGLNQVPQELMEEVIYSPKDKLLLNEMKFDEVVEEIALLEEEISEDFKEFRAADLADIQGTSFEQAMEVVNASLGENKNKPTGEREDLKEGLNSGQSHSESEDGGKDSQNGEGPSKQNESGSGAQQTANSPSDGHGQKKEGSARENSNTQGKGKQANKGNNSPVASSNSSPDGQEGIKTVGDLNAYRNQLNNQANSASVSHSKAKNMGRQAGVMSSTGKNVRVREASSLLGGNQRGRQGGGDFSSSSISGNRNQSGSYASAVLASLGSKKNQSMIKIPEEMVKAKALPGRKFEKKSHRQGWLYLDTWYVIGPWDNAGKLNYSRTHQPELEVDFEATYLNGKMNSRTGKPRELKWKFVQSNQMKIKMPDEQSNSTYYCSTEVYFEEATEMLVAIASDDAARLWVNEKLVWEDRGWSAWNLSEGFRRIHFNEGFNDVLVRLENFPVLCEFSVLLCPSK